MRGFMLNIIHHPGPTDRPKLLIAHGLFGSGRNWGVIAKRLSDSREVFAVDMRNHGVSPWFNTQSYTDMASDLAEVIEHIGGPVDLLGHSMGGKASMVLALENPSLIRRLVVADIAPVGYAHTQMGPIEAMRGVDLSAIERRSDAAVLLEVEEELKPFLLQSLDVKEKKWRLNLDVLADEMYKIIGFPEVRGVFDNPALFLTGATSEYVTHEHRPKIKSLFSNAKFAKIPGAGHWLHAEKPREFEAAVRVFLDT